MPADIKTALEQYQQAELYEQEQRELAIKDMLFVDSHEGQWDTDVVERRSNRPRYTIDRISGAINQIIGDYRENRTSIKIEPQHDGTEELAKLYTSLIRSIEELSDSQGAYDNAFQEQLKSGYAGWRILTEYAGDSMFEQNIVIKPLFSAASSLYYDPNAKDYNRENAEYMFYTSRMPIATFQKKYPKVTPVDFQSSVYLSRLYEGWWTSEDVRVAEYWYKVPVKSKLGLLSDGRTIDLKEEKDVLDELLEMGIQVVRERDVDTYKIYSVKMTGAEFLEDPQEWPGKYFPFAPLWGHESIIQGQRFIRGLVRKAVDPQRVYNYATSATVEATALSPKDPIFHTPAQIKNHERHYAEFPVRNTPFLPYNPDTQAPGPPQRGGAPQVQQALIMQLEQAKGDLHATTGLEPSSFGNAPDMMSGKAIQAQQAMGDRGAFIFYSNFEKSKRFTGKILVDLIPRIYDTERVMTVIGADEKREAVTLNQAAVDQFNQPIIDKQTGKQFIVNDLSQGDYSVSVSTGPAYATARQETVAQLTGLAKESELMQQLALDLIVDNMSLNNGEELKTRVRKAMIQQGTIEPTPEEAQEMGLDKPQQPSPMDIEVMQNLAAETQKILAEVRNKDADTQKKIYESQKITVQTITELINGFAKKMEQGLPVTAEEQRLYQGQEAIVGETQIDTLEKAELAGSQQLTPSPQANGEPPIPG